MSDPNIPLQTPPLASSPSPGRRAPKRGVPSDTEPDAAPADLGALARGLGGSTGPGTNRFDPDAPEASRGPRRTGWSGMVAAIPRAWPQTLVVLVVVAGSLAAPLVVSSANQTIYIFLLLSVMVVSGLSLLMGFAGQVSLGQGAFYAVGAYTAAILAVHGFPTLLDLVMAPLVTMAVAVVVGSPILKLRGHYLAFATLAFQLVVLGLISNLTSLTGGAPGITDIPTLSIAGFTFTTGTQYSYLAWAGAAVVVIVTSNLVRSRPGRALRALATNEHAASAVGVPVGRYRLSVFVLAAGFAGFAGGIYAFYLSFVSPTSFPLLLSIEFLIMAVIGGLGTVAGAVVGATLVTVTVQILITVGQAPGLPSYLPTVLSDTVYALSLILVLIFLPGGVVPAVQRLLRKLPGTSSQP